MGLHDRRAVKARPRAGAARDRLVVLVGLVAEGEVVHRALAGCHEAQRAVQRVGDAGRGLDVARHHRCRRVRVEHAARRHDDLQRLEATGVERDVVVHQRAEDIQHRGHGHRLGRVEVVGQLRAGAGEIDGGLAAAGIDRQVDDDLRAVVHGQREVAVLERRDDTPHRLFGVVLHMAHVAHHRGQAPLRHHRMQLLHAFLVGCDLGAQVGHGLVGVARRPAARAQPGTQVGLAQLAVAHQQQVVQQHTFFVDAAGKRWHRPRRDAADVGMVAAAGDIKPRLRAAGQVDRRHHRHVRQVGAAVVGVVEHIDIARLHGRVACDHSLDRLAHRAQVHRHVRRIGDQRALGVEQCTRKIQPLLDVDRVRGVLQPQPHLLGDVHEQVVEHLQHHRVGRRADGLRRSAGPHPAQRERPVIAHAGQPAGLDHRGGVVLGDHRRAVHRGAGGQLIALVQRRIAPDIGAAVVRRAVHLHLQWRRHWF